MAVAGHEHGPLVGGERRKVPPGVGKTSLGLVDRPRARAGVRSDVEEIDKIGADWRGDPTSTLLEVLDPAQYYAFTDTYLGVPFDLSQVLFIAPAKTLHTIPAPLLDPMKVLQLSDYTEDEKVHIAERMPTL